MVNIFLRFPSLLLTYFILLNSNVIASTYSSKLIVFCDKTESVIGRPIHVDVYGISLNSKIENLDLSKLNDNFGVVSDYVIQNISDNRWPHEQVQILKLKLYPRHTGLITIPSLVSKNAISKTIPVLISKDGIDPPKLILSSKKPYEQQQIIAEISVNSIDPTSRLSINDSLTINGFEITPLSFNRSKNKDGTYLLSIGLAVTPLKIGKQKIEIPPVKYSVSGVFRKLFYLPINIIDVKELPSYLPPTIPVGKIDIQSKQSTKWLLNTNTLSYWKIKISGNVSNPYRLPAILRQITSNKSIKFLPAKSERTIELKDNNLISIVNHSIPFKILKNGFVKLPQLKINYFDPGNGKITTMTYSSNNILSLNLFWRSVFILSISLILIYLSRIIYTNIQIVRRSRLKREQALHILKNGNTAENLREAMKLLAEAENWPSNTTLEQWSVFWKEKYQTKSNYNNFISSLSSCFYGSDKNMNIKNLSLQLLECVKYKKRH